MKIQQAALLASLALVHCKPTKTAAPDAGVTSTASAVVSASASAADTSTAPRHSGPVKPHASATGAIAIANAPDLGPDAGVPKETAETVGLPKVDFGPAGPLELKGGYPAPLELGMKDYATTVGFSKDASEVIACGSMSPMAPPNAKYTDCFFRRLAGKTEHAGSEDGKDGPIVGKALAAETKLLTEGTPIVLGQGRTAQAATVLPPPLKTTWGYAKDIVVWTSGDGGDLKIGGAVAGSEPVYPITMHMIPPVPEMTYSGAWNAIIPSPDRTELAFIGHFYCMEWCNDILIQRMTHGKLASHVFNDTGFRFHQKKDYAKSSELFLKAAWADPRAPLPPYNLACAYAQLKDEANATKALKLAISVGGEKIKARAKRDADFKGVLAAKWFTDLTK